MTLYEGKFNRHWYGTLAKTYIFLNESLEYHRLFFENFILYKLLNTLSLSLSSLSLSSPLLAGLNLCSSQVFLLIYLKFRQ